MADELDPVEQKFIADVEPYIEAVEEAAKDARDFADANVEATAGIDDMRDHATEAAEAVAHLRDDVAEAAEADRQLRDSAVEAAEALGHQRDEALAAAAAAGIYADKVGNLHEANGRFVSSARKAELGIDGIKDGLEDLMREADKAEAAGGGSNGPGLLQRILFGANKGIGSIGEGAGSGAEGIPLLGGGGLAGIAVLIPVIYAALAEVTALAGGFAAAAAGAGAFALLALPAIKAVSGALGDTHKKLMKLDPDERQAVYGIRELEREWKSMAKAFEPDAFKVFNAGLKLANELLPIARPFADTFANVLDRLLKQADKFAASKGFQAWVAQFHKLEGPALEAIGQGIGHVATAIGKLLTTMSAKDVVNAINIAFSILSGTISFTAFVVRRLMHSWDELSATFPAIEADAKAMRKSFDDMRAAVSRDFDDVRHAVADFAHNAASYFDESRANVARWAGDVRSDTDRVVAYFRALPGRILADLASLPGRMESLGRNIIDGLLHGIEAAAGGLLGEVEHLASDVSGAFSKVLGMLSPSRVFMQHGVNIIQGLLNGIRAKAPELTALMRGLGGQAGTGFSAGGGSSAGTSPSVHVTVPVTLAGGAAGYNDPRFLQYLQGVVQEAVLRYTQVNPTNGLRLAGKLS